ncbi:MAG: HEAT repeat domain-containing protein [Planctomycetota bacterium]
MYRLLVTLLVLGLSFGCRPRERSIFSDKEVSEKCRHIVEDFECWFDGATIKWLEETQWAVVSTRHKNMVIEAVGKLSIPYSSDYMKVYALGYMDPAYSFPRIVRLKDSQCPLARSRVAESILLEGQYKEHAIEVLVELLFDAEKNVRTSAACTVSRRLGKADSTPLLLLHYFENVCGRPVSRLDAISDTRCDWVEALANSTYGSVLVPWFEEAGRARNRGYMSFEPLWDHASREHNATRAEGRQIAQRMKKRYSQVIRRQKRG